jgi:hypothetical protein
MRVALGSGALCFPIPDGWSLHHDAVEKTIAITNTGVTVTFSYYLSATDATPWLERSAMVKSPRGGRRWLTGNALMGLAHGCRWLE